MLFLSALLGLLGLCLPMSGGLFRRHEVLENWGLIQPSENVLDVLETLKRRILDVRI